MDVAKIKALLLESVGNPESGAIKDNADAMAQAIANGFNDSKQETKEFNPVKETRVLKVSESR